jgi:hypothetical protein
MPVPHDWGKHTRLDYLVDGPIEEVPDWVVIDMARRGEEIADAELRRRGIEPPSPPTRTQ